MQNSTPTHADTPTNTPSVVIVGAGPVGLAAANLLGMCGVKTLLLERNATLSDCPKAITLDDEGLRVCQAMGLGDALLKHVVLDIEAHYVSQQRFLARVAPTQRRNGYPLISTFHQPEFEEILLQGLRRFPCVEVRFSHTVETFTQEREAVTIVAVTPDGIRETLMCAYLLACDGGKSPIRHLLGIAMQPPMLFSSRKKRSRRETDKRERWLVVDTINDDDTSTAATFFCSYKRPAVTIPAPHHARRWEFLLLRGERDEDLLNDTTIYRLMHQARLSQPTINSAIRKSEPSIIRKTVYAFRAVIAQRFIQGRVLLLGDAAHLMPPFGGQGMNSGLRDAHNLCWKLHLVLQKQAMPHLLTTYETERFPHVQQMILFSSLLGKIVMTTTRLGSWVRDRFFTLVNALPPARMAITEMRVKPQPRYTKGFLVPLVGTVNKKLLGAFLPQPLVQTQAGAHVLFDDILGSGFALIRLYKNPVQAFADVHGEIWQELGVTFVCVLPQRMAHDTVKHTGCEVIYDRDGILASFLEDRQDVFVLVRPDHYICGVFTVKDVRVFEKRLAELLRSNRVKR